MRTLSVITIVLALMVGFAGLAESQEVIGEIILSCGCTGYITYNQQNEYGLTIPNHGEKYKISVKETPGKFTIFFGQNSKFESIPPYEQWTWIESDGSAESLPKGSIGDQMCTIIYHHYITKGEFPGTAAGFFSA